MDLVIGMLKQCATVACADDPQVEVCAAEDRPVSLLTLPTDVLEAICARLSLRDRIALTSCCRAMLARPDIMSSEALWGDLKASTWHSEEKPRRDGQNEPLRQRVLGWLRVWLVGPGQPPLLAWLGQRLGGLRALQLDLSGEADAQEVARALAHASRLTRLELQFDSHSIARIPPCLASLPPAALVRLSASFCDLLGKGGARALAPLRHCTALTRLDLYGCGLRCLPGDLLASLPALAELGIGKNSGLQCGSELELARLTALTRLKVVGTPIARLPEQLAALPALRSLEVEVKQHLAQGQDADWEPLSTRLRSLRLEAWGLPALPPRLSVLAGLGELSLDGSLSLGALSTPPTALEPLQHLSALTWLSLRFCKIHGGLPSQLSVLCQLVYLDISDNLRMGDDEGEAAFEPLRDLTALEYLDMSNSNLVMLPPQLSACTLLACLNLGKNRFEFRNSLSTLQHLHGLTYLDLSSCSLRGLPPQLSACTALRELWLGSNPDLGSAEGSEAFEPLCHLASLTHVSLRNCNLKRLPPQLSACAQLSKLDISYNGMERWGEGALEMLRHLTALGELDATKGGEQGQQAWPDQLPPVLCELVATGLVLRQ